MKKKVSIIRLIIVILLLLVAAVISYLLYVVLQYSRISDDTRLQIEGTPSESMLQEGKSYSAVSYNIGFGAYSPDFSFFMDTGKMADGTPVRGRYGKGINKENVLRDINGAIKELQTLDADIVLLQEVDVKSNRSYFVNERQMIQASLPGRNSIFASNFHTAYLLYPFSDPHGASQSGLFVLSKQPVEAAVRKSYPVDDTIPNKLFDLDRCFSVCTMPVDNGKNLILIDSHMSAYDEGGTIRKQQLKTLNTFMEEEYRKGNYVIVGGDFNQILGEDLMDLFPSKQQTPDWISILKDEEIASCMSIVRPKNASSVPTCRSADLPWKKGVNYCAIIDGFIVSKNVKASATNINDEFAWSDHQPVKLTFTLL